MVDSKLGVARRGVFGKISDLLRRGRSQWCSRTESLTLPSVMRFSNRGTGCPATIRMRVVCTSEQISPLGVSKMLLWVK
jgi:hypothetical protein